MRGKFLWISWFEWAFLLLTVVFVVGTLLWFFVPREREELVVYTEFAFVAPSLDWPPDEDVVAPGMLEGERLDLNTAAAEDLTRLPGIGEAKAKAIVAWREEHGGFSDVEVLLDVPGIGEATLETLRPYVTTGTAEGGN